MGDVVRLKHIDRIRGIAILCMVQVHTAAIIPPEGITVGHPIAFISASIGGMAAPMFVTISGWGIYRSAKRRWDAISNIQSWFSWILPRVIILTLCQMLVNISLNLERGGRFLWMTPGVLTLLAIGSIFGPALVKLSHRVKLSLLLILMFSPIFIGDMNGINLSWTERVSSVGILEWFERLILSGTYPALPWLSFIVLGCLIEDLNSNLRKIDPAIKLSLVLIITSILYSIQQSIPWALTEGEAVLTFFPANSMFIFTSGIFVIIIFRILQGNEIQGGEPAGGDKYSWLEPAGRLSLTIYVLHFIFLGIIAYYIQDSPRLEIYLAFTVTIVHTAVWIPLAIIHEKYIPKFSFEELLRIYS